jgi:hypothetical protein
MRRSIAIPLVATLLAIGLARPQDAPAAEIRCEYNPDTRVLSVSVRDSALGEELVLRRAGSQIHVSEFLGPQVNCHGTPTITNTDLIKLRARGPNEIALDLFKGPFAPGATPEPDGSSEIEIRASGREGTFWLEGGPAAEHFRYMSSSGQNGLNLNTGPGDEDIDLLLPPKAELYVDGRRGSDTIDVVPPVDLEVAASGGRGNDTLLSNATEDVGEFFSGSLLEGGKGRDRIVGSPLFDYILPGPGADIVEAEGGSDAIGTQLDKRRDRIDCGSGNDAVGSERRGAAVDPFDQVRRCEYVQRPSPR